MKHQFNANTGHNFGDFSNIQGFSWIDKLETATSVKLFFIQTLAYKNWGKSTTSLKHRHWFHCRFNVHVKNALTLITPSRFCNAARTVHPSRHLSASPLTNITYSITRSFRMWTDMCAFTRTPKPTSTHALRHQINDAEWTEMDLITAWLMPKPYTRCGSSSSSSKHLMSMAGKTESLSAGSKWQCLPSKCVCETEVCFRPPNGECLHIHTYTVQTTEPQPQVRSLKKIFTFPMNQKGTSVK